MLLDAWKELDFDLLLYLLVAIIAVILPRNYDWDFQGLPCA